MKLARLLSAIKKAGLHVTVNEGRYYVTPAGKNYGTFWAQGDRAVCVSTCRVGDGPDSMTDYFPQQFHDTIKGFIWNMLDGAEAEPAPTCTNMKETAA